MQTDRKVGLVMKALIKRCWDLYKKYEEGINYLIFGFLAFVLNYILYYLFESILHMNYLVATGLSWALTVIFAYWTNRTFVFKSKNSSTNSVAKEFVSFIGARIATEFLEVGFMYLAVDVLSMNLHRQADWAGTRYRIELFSEQIMDF